MADIQKTLKTRTYLKYTKLLITIAAFIIISLSFYFFLKKKNDQKIQWHMTEYPIRKTLQQYVTASGRLKAQDEITIGSLVDGRIIKLYADDNDFVKKGQVLVELDNGIGDSAVKKATSLLLESKATLNYLTNFYNRQKQLYETGQLASDAFESIEKDYKTAQARVLQTEAELEIRKQEYNNLFVKAPDDGIVIAKKINLGQMVTSRLQATELFIIAKNLKKMEAEIDVDESDVGFVKDGQEAIFTVDAFPQRPFSAKVKQINYSYKVIDNVISYGVILDVENEDLTLRPGMTTNVDINVANAENALCVPNKALRINRKILEQVAEKEHYQLNDLPQTVSTKRQESVWIKEDHSFKEVRIKTGVSSGRYTQVTEGLTETDLIIVEVFDPERQNPVFSMGKMRV